MYQRNNLNLDKNSKDQLDYFLNKNISGAKKLKKNLVQKYLTKKNYFFIYEANINSKKDFEKKLKLISRLFGKLVGQNSKGQKIVKIKPKNVKNNKINLKNKLRYHQTNTGGSIHTDGPQLDKSPKFLIMGCYNQSKNGGESVIVNGKKIYNKFNQSTKKTLNTNFFFEKRGFGKKILKKPIFKVSKKIFIFRYLREYLIKAYEMKNISLEKEKKKVIEILDKSLNNKSNQISFKLKKKQIIVINNHICAHGRKKFTIEKDSPRLLYRLWAQ